MLDHVGLSVSNLKTARKFYDATLAPLGISIIMEVTPEESGTRGYLGYGAAGKPFFWMGEGQGGHVHVGLVAKNRAAVDAFYHAALAAGGRDNGAPGLRPHYHPNYYGAFVLDADGHNIEAVCHTP